MKEQYHAMQGDQSASNQGHLSNGQDGEFDPPIVFIDDVMAVGVWVGRAIALMAFGAVAYFVYGVFA